MKKVSDETCPCCGRNYCASNWKSRHHILPKRMFGGGGGLFTLCRQCHNELELKIPIKKQLSVSRYYQILRKFIAKKKGERNDSMQSVLLPRTL